MGDGAVLAPDSFLMKGEEVAPHGNWGGNPALEIFDSTATADASRDGPRSRAPRPGPRPDRPPPRRPGRRLRGSPPPRLGELDRPLSVAAARRRRRGRSGSPRRAAAPCARATGATVRRPRAPAPRPPRRPPLVPPVPLRRCDAASLFVAQRRRDRGARPTRRRARVHATSPLAATPRPPRPRAPDRTVRQLAR